MDLKRLSSFLLTSIKHTGGQTENKDKTASSEDRNAVTVGGRRRALSSYTYSVDAKCRLVDGKSPSSHNAARRSQSSRYRMEGFILATYVRGTMAALLRTTGVLKAVKPLR
uniref:Uncharacterized protein n=1 Tax=Romanomermis culicivorax TaxID=13658 RepID=A0A915KSZ3_ROMCU